MFSSILVGFFSTILNIYFVLIIIPPSLNTYDFEEVKPEVISFEILKKDKPIGYLTISKEVHGEKVVYNAESEVTAKFILTFKASGKEKSVYQNGRLVYSSVYRKINSKVKLDQHLLFKDGKYLFTDESSAICLENIHEIRRNLITLLCSEPITVGEVYSDKFKQMISIHKLGPSKYKVIHPNGDYTLYTYRKGKCIEAMVFGSFFKVKLKPNASI